MFTQSAQRTRFYAAEPHSRWWSVVLLQSFGMIYRDSPGRSLSSHRWSGIDPGRLDPIGEPGRKEAFPLPACADRVVKTGSSTLLQTVSYCATSEHGGLVVEDLELACWNDKSSGVFVFRLGLIPGLNYPKCSSTQTQWIWSPSLAVTDAIVPNVSQT